MADESDDDLLIARALKGEMVAFRTLVDRYEGKVAGVTKSILGDCPEAYDVGQEVFIRFYQSMDRFKGESGLGTYLARIAINLSLNEIKKRKKKAFLFFPLEAARNVSSEEKENDDEIDSLRREIEKLEPEFRVVLSLRVMQGYSTEETAEILKVPQGTVLSRLYRAQKKLKESLSKHNNL
jgi:RNA polymerase sigma-70 factor (ECF subfamily)